MSSSIAVRKPSTLSDPAGANAPAWWQLGIIFCALALLLYGIVGKLVYDWWTDPNFSHGFFVPLFSGFVAWQNRKDLEGLPARPSWWGIGFIALGLATLVVGVLGAELFLSRSSMVVMLAGVIIYFWGWQYFRALLFPWAFLFLMIPLPSIVFNQITMPLQFLASKMAAWLLPFAGVPVLREGNVIQLASMRLEVAEACSGIRSLMSLTTLAIMYGYFLESKIWKRVVLGLAAVPIAVLANGFRVFGTGLCVQYWDPDKAEGFFHEFSGWIIFIVSVVLLMSVQKLLQFGANTKEAA